MLKCRRAHSVLVSKRIWWIIVCCHVERTNSWQLATGWVWWGMHWNCLKKYSGDWLVMYWHILEVHWGTSRTSLSLPLSRLLKTQVTASRAGSVFGVRSRMKKSLDCWWNLFHAIIVIESIGSAVGRTMFLVEPVSKCVEVSFPIYIGLRIETRLSLMTVPSAGWITRKPDDLSSEGDQDMLSRPTFELPSWPFLVPSWLCSWNDVTWTSWPPIVATLPNPFSDYHHIMADRESSISFREFSLLETSYNEALKY